MNKILVTCEKLYCMSIIPQQLYLKRAKQNKTEKIKQTKSQLDG